MTNLEYDSSERLTKLVRVNSAVADIVTRLAYPSATQTVVAGPNTNQSQPVTAVPRSTFYLDATGWVTAATDPMGRAQGASYTADFDVATATSGARASAGTTTNAFGAGVPMWV